MHIFEKILRKIVHSPEPPGLLARRHELMLLPPPHEGHPVLHVLEEVCLLNREVLVHYLEELSVSEDVGGADLHRHGGQLVQGCLAGVVVKVGAGRHSLPQSLSHPNKHPLDHAHAVLGERPILISMISG